MTRPLNFELGLTLLLTLLPISNSHSNEFENDRPPILHRSKFTRRKNLIGQRPRNQFDLFSEFEWFGWKWKTFCIKRAIICSTNDKLFPKRDNIRTYNPLNPARGINFVLSRITKTKTAKRDGGSGGASEFALSSRRSLHHLRQVDARSI